MVILLVALAFIAAMLILVFMAGARKASESLPVTAPAPEVVFDASAPLPVHSSSYKGPHRQYSQSEQRELATLFNEFVIDGMARGVPDTELAEAVVVIAETFDDALKLRYGVK